MNYPIKFKPVQIIKLQRKLTQYGLVGLTGLIELAAGQSSLYVATIAGHQDLT